MNRLALVLLVLLPYMLRAQFHIPQRSGNVVTPAYMDSLKLVQPGEISAYLGIRPAFGDTAGRTKDIIKILQSAKFIYSFTNNPDFGQALARAEENFRIRNMVDKVLVVKSKRRMYLMKQGAVIKEFAIALGPKPVGQKEHEGDGKTPTGVYTLDWQRHDTPNFHSFHISYPNAADIERARQKGLKAGSNIMIHGTNGKKTKKDWTNGCIALSNADMTEFKKIVFQDTIIEIIE